MVKELPLAAKLDTSAAAELRASLQAVEHDDVVLDASSVEMIGGMCLEVLLTAAAHWKTAGHKIAIQDVSPQMSEDLAWFGLSADTLLEYTA